MRTDSITNKKRGFAAVVILCIVLSSQAIARPGVQQRGPERLALFPLEQKGLAAEEVAALRDRLAELLRINATFDVMKNEEMERILAEAEFKNVETCDYSYCLADAGKVLGVNMVLHASVTRQGKLYRLRLRLIDVRDVKIVYDKRSEFSGEFDQFLSDMIPAEAQSTREYSVKSETKWYVVTVAAILAAGTIYWIYRSFDKSGGSENTGDGPSTQQ